MDAECPVAWELQSLQADNSWVTIDAQSGQACHQGTAVTYTLHRTPYTAAATELRWKFTEGVGGNANGIRLAEISLYAEAETSAGDYGEVS